MLFQGYYWLVRLKPLSDHLSTCNKTRSTRKEPAIFSWTAYTSPVTINRVDLRDLKLLVCVARPKCRTSSHELCAWHLPNTKSMIKISISQIPQPLQAPQTTLYQKFSKKKESKFVDISKVRVNMTLCCDWSMHQNKRDPQSILIYYYNALPIRMVGHVNPHLRRINKFGLKKENLLTQNFLLIFDPNGR